MLLKKKFHWTDAVKQRKHFKQIPSNNSSILGSSNGSSSRRRNWETSPNPNKVQQGYIDEGSLKNWCEEFVDLMEEFFFALKPQAISVALTDSIKSLT